MKFQNRLQRYDFLRTQPNKLHKKGRNVHICPFLCKEMVKKNRTICEDRADKSYSSASEHWKVFPLVMSPVSSPSLNHFIRCLLVPWLNDSGTA